MKCTMFALYVLGIVVLASVTILTMFIHKGILYFFYSRYVPCRETCLTWTIILHTYSLFLLK